MTYIRKVPGEIKIYRTPMVPMASLASRILRRNLGVVQIITRCGDLHRRFHHKLLFPKKSSDAPAYRSENRSRKPWRCPCTSDYPYG